MSHRSEVKQADKKVETVSNTLTTQTMNMSLLRCRTVPFKSITILMNKCALDYPPLLIATLFFIRLLNIVHIETGFF